MSIKKEQISVSPSQTQTLGQQMAKEILKAPLRKGAVVVGLMGDLGGGKTTFLKGFAKGLGIKKKILSPTFIIFKRFTIYPVWSKGTLPFTNFYHLDCYRIKKSKEILDLGFQEIITDPKNIVCIEWADRIKKILPKESILLKFKFKGKNKRRITLIPAK